MEKKIWLVFAPKDRVVGQPFQMAFFSWLVNGDDPPSTRHKVSLLRPIQKIQPFELEKNFETGQLIGVP